MLTNNTFTVIYYFYNRTNDYKMALEVSGWLNKKYPQNYIIKNPYIGVLIFLAFIVFFVIVYKPIKLHESRFFNYEMTIAIYCIIIAVPLIGLLKILKTLRYFSNPDEWTIGKEILSAVTALLGMGVIVYLSGFFLETPGSRLNLLTFFDSLFSAFLIGIIPFAFFSIINYQYLFVSDIVKNFSTDINSLTPQRSEELIRIESQLKKEELAFYPSQFIYAESDGNYVIFHLIIESQIKSKIIRNSINNIEQQLSVIQFFVRIHRAFIVNIKMVSSQKGNTLGYRLKLSMIDKEIPVSRQKTRDFDQLLKQYR